MPPTVCLPLLISSCTIKSRSSLLALAHPGGPGKRAVNGCGGVWCTYATNDDDDDEKIKQTAQDSLL